MDARIQAEVDLLKDEVETKFCQMLDQNPDLIDYHFDVEIKKKEEKKCQNLKRVGAMKSENERQIEVLKIENAVVYFQK
uniref:Uncharacterized protein n=1 Tax=Panagrolaimus superbus TaxID=310955 RepID=A0A914Y6E8_9BILA